MASISTISQVLFQIIVLIFSIFSFSFLLAIPSTLVKAQVTQTCCEKLKGAELYCQNAYPDSCDPAFASAPTSCEATSFCKLGCCYDSVEGICAENTPKKLCELRNGTWSPQADCKIPQCSLGCCVLGDEASLTTLVRCKKLANYYGLEADYRPGIITEEQCIAIAQAQDKGACVIEMPQGERTCKFTTRAECKRLTGNESAFYKDFLCSAEELGTNCARQHHTGCIEGKDEVYWFDSCGNPENIYDADKEKSWNNGRVLSKEESCNPESGNVNSKYCGNCNYFLGSMCGKYRSEKGEPKPIYGEYICRDLNCYNTYNGKNYKHGESWCVYDEPAGQGRDAVGSRHFRHLCIQGEEKVEPCDDYRQGICVEGTYEIGGENFTEALCRPNRWRDCLNIDNKKECEDKTKRDCYWYDAGGSIGSFCLPNVPGGLKFWEVGGQAKTICSAASRTCVAVMEKKPFGSWKCIQNCECLTEAWTEKMNKICTSLGDCGAYVNVVGKYTDDGYQISDEGKKLRKGFMKAIGKGIGRLGLAYLASLVTITIRRIILKLPLVKKDDYLSYPLLGLKGLGEAIYTPARIAANILTALPSGGVGLGASNLLRGTAFQSPIQLKATQKVYVEILKARLEELGPGVHWCEAGKCVNILEYVNNPSLPRPILDMSAVKGAKIKIDNVIQGFKEKNAFVYKNGKAIGIRLDDGSRTTQALASGWYPDKQGTLKKLIATKKNFEGPLDPKFMKIKGANSKPLHELQLFDAKGESAKDITDLARQYKTPSYKTAQFTQQITSFINTLIGIYSIYSMIQTIMELLTKRKQVTVTFTCLPWQPPSGGEDCELCNSDPMKPCSEYRCKSLGASCELLNIGTGNETCVNINPQDTNAPQIKPWRDVLTYGHTYIDVKPCPPGPGCWKIIRMGAKDGCIKAFTPLRFGISTNEPAQCKIDYNHTKSFEDMKFWFGETNLYLYNRSMKLSLPGPDHINRQSPEIKNDGRYTLYIRCRDANGNTNLGEMAISFCVEPGPDTTPPVIERTSIDNGAPVAYGTREANLDIYLNEPAECRWSFTDQDYENMNNSFECATGIEQVELDLTYKCSTLLTGIDDNTENIYYIRCKDQPWLSPANESDRNVNKQSYIFKLQGTIPLNISSVTPNGTIEGGGEPIKVKLGVETVNGFNNGMATCYFSPEGYENMIEFFNTGSNKHEQELALPVGSYTYYILCRDLAGNIDKAKTSFTTEVDNEVPMIIRIYQEAGMLKIITDEPSDCRYSIQGCNFDFTTGIEMPFDSSTEHTAEWRTDITYYIKCRDEFGNMPAQSECTMRINAYDVPVGE